MKNISFFAAALAVLSLLCLVSCGSAPAVHAPQSAEQNSGASAADEKTALGEGTSLRDKGSSSQRNDQKKAIEADLTFGSPLSLDEAFSLIAKASLPAEDIRDYAWLAAGICKLIYPEMADSMIPPNLRISDNAVPSSPLCRIFAEAQKGRVAALPAHTSALGTLLSGLAVFSSTTGDVPRLSMAALDSFDSMDSFSVLPALARGREAERTKELDMAVSYYTEALGLSGDVWPAELGLARIYLAQSRPQKALELLRGLANDSALKPLVSSRRFVDVYAPALYYCGFYAEAEPQINRVLSESPSDYLFVLMKADLLVRAGAFQQALPLLEKYAAGAQTSRLYLYVRAKAADGLKNREDALKWARRGLDVSPDDPELLAISSRLVFEQAALAREPQKRQLQDEARGYAEKALRLASQGTVSAAADEAAAGASWLLLKDAVERYDWNSAGVYLKRAGKKGGYGPKDRGIVCLVLRKNKNWESALAIAGAWYSEDSSSEPALLAYVGALIGSRQEKNAADLIASYLAAGAGGSPAFRSSLYYYKSLIEKTDDGKLADLRQALIENSDNEDALIALFDIHFARRDYTKAGYYLKQALTFDPANPELLTRESALQSAESKQSGTASEAPASVPPEHVKP